MLQEARWHFRRMFRGDEKDCKKMLLEGGKFNDTITFVNMKNRKNELDNLVKNIPDRVLKLSSGFFWLLILKHDKSEIG